MSMSLMDRMRVIWEPWLNRIDRLLQEQWLPRYRQLSRREQQLLHGAGILLPLLVVVFGILLPLHDRQLALRANVAALKQQAAEAQMLAGMLAGQGKAGIGRRHASVMASVEKLGKRVKLREYMTRIRPQPGGTNGVQRLLLQMKDAPYASLVRFQHALAQDGLHLLSIRIQQGSRAGFVHVQAVIEG